MLGGTQSLHTNSYDEALALPTEEAVRVALRTQQVIAHESGVTNTIDPLGGSYFVETLTDEMEAAAYDYFARIDELGGMVEAIKQTSPSARSPTPPSATSGRSTEAADRRRRQRLHPARTRTEIADPAHRPGAGAQAGRPPRGDPRRAATAPRSSAALAELQARRPRPTRT